jgi:DNA-binding FadR family transcriptional regulator
MSRPPKDEGCAASQSFGGSFDDDAYRHLALRVPGRLSEAAEAHIGILDVIVASDSPTAQRLMASHADIQKNDFAQYISIIEAAESRP